MDPSPSARGETSRPEIIAASWRALPGLAAVIAVAFSGPPSRAETNQAVRALRVGFRYAAAAVELAAFGGWTNQAGSAVVVAPRPARGAGFGPGRWSSSGPWPWW